MANNIMSWSKCSVKIGKTGAADALATALTSVGAIKDKSATLEVADGDKLQAKESGGVLYAQQVSEGEITLKMRVIEPTFEFEAALTGATPDATKGELKVTSNVVVDDMSVEVTPKNIGATGIRIRKSSLVYKPGYSEEEGNYADLTFTVLACADKELYTKFKTKAAV
ncbi:MAG: hypothetical protein RR960_06540 [Alistipes sp.]